MKIKLLNSTGEVNKKLEVPDKNIFQLFPGINKLKKMFMIERKPYQTIEYENGEVVLQEINYENS